MKKPFIVFCFLFFTLAACTSGTGNNEAADDLTATSLPVPTETLTATLPPGVTPSATASITPTLAPDAWKTMPVFPQDISERMIEVYQRGLARGRDSKRFSKFGDCQSVNPYFLTMFDTGDYRLGDYAYLQPTIDHFAGSWARDSFGVKGGFNVASVQTLYWTDPANCGKNTPPMACEINKFNPSIVVISFEVWWEKPAADYEMRMHSLVDFVLSQDVVPILATKADNYEGNDSVNAAIARVAYDYGIPLWNFWAATYPLDGHGVTEDG
ncbi:MAG: hypothetical protein AB1531_10695, partial [Chloroflexota bacterium]